MIVKTQCKKCGAVIRLDFGTMTKEQAVAAVDKMDQTPRECPGQHVELSGWRALYDLENAIHRAYDLGEGEESLPVMTDRKYVESLMSAGKEVIDGGLDTVPELSLPRLHDFSGLEHIGFGNFRSTTHLFLRCDSPQGTRFYERVPVTDAATGSAA